MFNARWFVPSFSAAATMGVASHDLFEVADLYDASNMRGVLASIHALGLVASSMPGYAGPLWQWPHRR